MVGVVCLDRRLAQFCLFAVWSIELCSYWLAFKHTCVCASLKDMQVSVLQLRLQLYTVEDLLVSRLSRDDLLNQSNVRPSVSVVSTFSKP